MRIVLKGLPSRLYLYWRRPLARNASGISHDAPKKPILTLFTKEICPLCEEAKHELADLLSQVEFRTVDIEKDPELYSKYKYDIPVFHLNGKFLFKHRANRQLLEEELRKLSRPAFSPS